MVAAVAIAFLAVWWYVPPLAEIAERRAERDQLEASIEDLTKSGADQTQHPWSGSAVMRARR